MRVQYKEWIRNNVVEPWGACEDATRIMVGVFPELTRVRGHYVCLSWGLREHWWLVEFDGSIVDPTAAQFPCSGTSVYIPWEEGAEEPRGKCINCGEYVFSGRITCCRACADDHALVGRRG